ncbi:MAG: hypothetical protein I8H71_01310 [Xanthomonadaceae bacterium]|nr:hypothetical protein [Xanthomonadaceae bacterium]
MAAHLAATLGGLSVICLAGMWLALESDYGPAAGICIVAGSALGVAALLALAF